jgi:4-amino-4-deoxy-L-arabinose transferase-like glycosyltransferase
MISLKKNIDIFLLLFSASLIIKIFILLFYKFDGFYGQDSYAYYEYSKAFISSVNNFKIPDNFYFPVGFYLFTYAVNIFTFGNTNIASLIVSLISNSFIPALTFLVSTGLLKNCFSEKETGIISLFAAVIMCASGSLIQAGIVIMSDSLGLALALTSVVLLIKYTDSGKLVYSLFSFVFLSLSIMTRYINILFIPLFILIFFSYLHSFKMKVNLKHLFLSLVIAVIVFLPQLYYILKFGVSYLRPEEGPGQWTTQWSLLNLFKRDFFIADGTFTYTLWNSVYYAAAIFNPMNFLLFGIFFISGLYFIAVRKYRLLLIIPIAWIFMYYIFLSGMPIQVSRYTMIYSPSVAIIASLGIFETFTGVKLRKIIFVSLMLILFCSGMYRINNFLVQKERDMQVVEFVNNNVENKSTLFSFFITGTINHYSPKKSLELYYFNVNKIKGIIDSSMSNVYFVIPETIINNQWKGLTLEQTFSFVKSNYNPEKIGYIDIYTIYCIKKL